jgi:uncharacterized protein (TIGR02646 family)
MRAITKGPEPALLRTYRAVPGATYDGKDFTPVKDEIRRALLRDQLALCCYCLRRISEALRPAPDGREAPALVQMKVEHWQSQVEFPHLQLTWTNLLGACLGGVGASPAAQTCDTRKGEKAIAFSPLDPAHVATLYCTSAGRLVSRNPRFDGDINERLNLNHTPLAAARKARLTADLEHLIVKYRAAPRIPESAVRRSIVELEGSTEGKSPELCGVLRLWARKRYGGEW